MMMHGLANPKYSSALLLTSKFTKNIYVKIEQTSERKHFKLLGYYTLCLQDGPT
jgi:hypothetical protein